MTTPFLHVACCVDQSSASRRAIAMARAVAAGRITLVHVVTDRLPYQGGFGAWTPRPAEISEGARAWLEHLAAEIDGAEAVTLRGNPAREVCDWAAHNEVDLIVAAAHDIPGERILRGSFSAHLAGHAPCSVLLARPTVGPEHQGDRPGHVSQEVV
jgi:nucleotide-binding universal stress UspA family protein